MEKLPNVLVIDDDIKYSDTIRFSLKNIYNVISVSNASDARNVLRGTRINAIILDYYLGQENGLSVLDALKGESPKIPFIIISGMVNLEMAVGFLKRRIFGFLEKPVSLVELKSLLDETTKIYNPNPLAFKLNYELRQVEYNGLEMSLTPTEFEILNFFEKNSGMQLTRSQIIQHVWGSIEISKNVLDTHLLNLKKKLPPLSEKLISIYGFGFYYAP